MSLGRTLERTTGRADRRLNGVLVDGVGLVLAFDDG